jgi:hypothetical protein
LERDAQLRAAGAATLFFLAFLGLAREFLYVTPSAALEINLGSAEMEEEKL